MTEHRDDTILLALTERVSCDAGTGSRWPGRLRLALGGTTPLVAARTRAGASAVKRMPDSIAWGAAV